MSHFDDEEAALLLSATEAPVSTESDAAAAAGSSHAHLSKKEAKAQLSKEEYKQWKRAHGADDEEEGEKKSKKDKKFKEKKDKSKKDKKSKSASKKEKKSAKKAKGSGSDAGDSDFSDSDHGEDLMELSGADDDDDAFADRKQRARAARQAKGKKSRGDDAYANNVTAPSTGRARIVNTVVAAVKDSRAKFTARSDDAAKAQAQALVQRMRAAREADDAARRSQQPPLHRIALCADVLQTARSRDMHTALVDCGFLQELSGWIASRDAQELAPADLRATALAVLETIPLAGSRDPPRKKGADEDIVNITPLISRTALQATDLGWAVNFQRASPAESAEFRTRANRVLAVLSRVFAEEGLAARDDAARRRLYRHARDPNVLPPFTQLPSTTERYLRASQVVDPQDPMSYLTARRENAPKAVISGMYRLSQGVAARE